MFSQSSKVKLLLWLAVLGLSVASYAGQEGHGGAGVLCYETKIIRDDVLSDLQVNSSDANHHIQTEVDLKLDKLDPKLPPHMVEVSDFRKGQGLFSVKHPAPSGSLSVANIYETIHRADLVFWNLFSPYITQENQWIPEASGVIEVDDATFSGRFSERCLVVQVARFDDATQRVHYDERIVSLMSETDKVALKLHEDLFSFYRAQARSRTFKIDRFVDRIAKAHQFSTGGDLEGLMRIEYSLVDKKSVRIVSINSDSVRELVIFLIKNETYDGQQFYSVASKVAIDLVWHNGFSYTGLKAAYSNEKISSRPWVLRQEDF